MLHSSLALKSHKTDEVFCYCFYAALAWQNEAAAWAIGATKNASQVEEECSCNLVLIS